MQLFYTVNSPFARKVRIVLAERGIPHEATTVDLAHLPGSYGNPNRKVPCLVDGKQTLYESNLVIEYLLQVPGGTPAPEQPALARTLFRPDHRWDDLALLATVETLLDAGINVYQLKRDGVAPEQSLMLRRELARIQSELDWLETRATPEGFMPGTFSIQDLNLAVALLWLDFRKPAEWRGRPKLEALVGRYEGRASFRSTQPSL